MSPRQLFPLALLTLTLAACASPSAAPPSELGPLGRPPTKLSTEFNACWARNELPAHRQGCIATETALQHLRLEAADRDAETIYSGERRELQRKWREEWKVGTDEACAARESPNEAERLDGAYCLMIRTAQAAEERETANVLERDDRG
jgi:hypothetical protein